MAAGLGLRHRLVGTQQVEDEMMADDPIAEARCLLAEHASEWGADSPMYAMTVSPRLLQALIDRLEAAERLLDDIRKSAGCF